MEEALLLVFGLLFLISVLVMVGNKINVSQPIILVLGGLIIGVVPGMPAITIGPELIFTIFLPPILFDAAWYTSWKDFWKNRSRIFFLAFGLVFFNSLVVAYVSSALIPGFTMALGFLLGGIISPPDAVAAVSVLRKIPMPKRIVTILEGESLLNDASSLIVVRFALLAIISGTFSFKEAAGDFFMVVTMGSLIGLGIAYLISLFLRFLPTTTQIDSLIMLIAPYLMFLLAEHFHYSGVLSVVVGGLFLSYRSHQILNHASRFQSTSIWESFIFLLQGLVFILIGLQLPDIIKGFSRTTLSQAIIYGVIISVVVIAVRMIWIYFRFFITMKDEKTDDKKTIWKYAFVLGWSGMRGVVSLAAALNIPFYLNDGSVFPFRNLILFITFVVILFTLLLHGLTLPYLVKKLDLEDLDEVMKPDEQRDAIQMRLSNLALASLNADGDSNNNQNPYVERLKEILELRLNTTIDKLAVDGTTANQKKMKQEYKAAYKGIINLQRQELASMRRDNIFLDDIIREAQDRLDLEELRLSQE